MNSFKKFLFVFLSFFCTIRANAQDIHYTQFWATPVYLNPALTASMPEDIRFSLYHRNQWRAVSVPYITFSASLEARKPLFTQIVQLGYGVNFDSDKAGEAGFGSNQVHIPLAISFNLKSDSSIQFSAGTSMGVSQSGLNFDKLTFDNQYNGLYFDPFIAAPALVYEQTMYFDLSTGINISYSRSTFNILIGSGFHHINTPQSSVLQNINIHLRSRISAYTISTIQLNQTFSLQPAILWQWQSKANEKVFGANVILHTQSAVIENLSAGLWGRWQDAMSLSLGASAMKFDAGINYDFNISDLKTVSRARGGIEIYLIYKFHKLPIIKVPYHSCPVFY